MSERHWFGCGSGSGGRDSPGRGHPIMYGDPRCTTHFDDMPEGGGYPHGFVEWALKKMGSPDPGTVLHLCSGSMRSGITVDVRAVRGPSVVADCRSTPFADESFDAIMVDPPYSAEYAANLYDTEGCYPLPMQILNETCRLLRPFGRVGLLHFQVPMFRAPLRLLGCYGVTTGLGYAIRAWTLFEKMPEQLSLLAAGPGGET